MIAKNVGIRRARGEFILATNIDIVFSDELIKFLAARRLEKGRMYRIDRTDVMSDVPLHASLDEQLAYCRQHVIRLCAREGNYSLTVDGFRENEAPDITRPGSGIYFGNGWFSVERWETKPPFRWIAGEAEINLAKVRPEGGILVLEVEAGPGIGSAPAVLQVLDKSGSLVAEWRVEGRATLELVLPPELRSGAQSFRLRVREGGLARVDDPRILNFRVFRCDWLESRKRFAAPQSALAVVRETRPLLTRMLADWRASRGIVSLVTKGPAILRRTVALLGKRGGDIFETGMEYRMGEGWHELERAPAEKFRWVSEAQLAVRVTAQMSSLALILEPGPGIGFQPFTLVIKNSARQVIGRAPIRGVTYVDVPLPMPSGTFATLMLTAEVEATRTHEDPRLLSFRVHACGAGARSVDSADAFETGPARFWMALTAGSSEADVEWDEMMEKCQAQIVEMGRPLFLHSNACGDFTLMAREHWHDLRGYPELDLFSMHLDSLLCAAAHHGGAREEILPEPMRIFHIEHAIGSGWTPEGQAQLYERLARKRIQTVSYEEVAWLVTQMRYLRAPVVFNLEDWGLAGTALEETSPAKVSYASGFDS